MVCKLNIFILNHQLNAFHKFITKNSGAQIGTLELIANGITIWSLTGQQANSWLLATLKLQPGNYMVC